MKSLTIVFYHFSAHNPILHIDLFFLPKGPPGSPYSQINSIWACLKVICYGTGENAVDAGTYITHSIKKIKPILHELDLVF